MVPDPERNTLDKEVELESERGSKEGRRDLAVAGTLLFQSPVLLPLVHSSMESIDRRY
jgi:hypothetical protein